MNPRDRHRFQPDYQDAEDAKYEAACEAANKDRRVLAYILDHILGKTVAQRILRDMVDDEALSAEAVLKQLSDAEREHIVDAMAIDALEANEQ